MSERTFILIQSLAFIIAIASGALLLYGEHLRAEQYKHALESAVDTIQIQNGTLARAQKALILANDAIGACVDTVIKSREIEHGQD